MSTQLGRISGPLLKDNLLRDGVDLAFETDLLYIDVINQKIGIRSSAPTRDLYSPNNIKTTNIIIDTTATIDTTISIDNASNISNLFEDIIISASKVQATHLGVGGFDIDANKITQTDSNADFELRPNGNGIVKIVNDLNIFGNLHATGNVTLDGNITFGTDINDNVQFAADVNSNFVPDPNETHDLGIGSKKWENLYAEFLNGEILSAESLLLGGIDNSLRQGNIWFVAAAGSSDYAGNHQNGPFESLERALANAAFGDVIYVYPGTYYELLPLTIPAGVSIKGVDIRTVIIEPDTASGGQDVFLLNDACTISDLTIKNHTFDSLNNTGYAFRFANNINVQTRSPYVQNITVITSGPSAGKGAYVDGAAANSATIEASLLFHSATFITPNVDCITMINGVRVEWLNSFTYYANRGLYALQGTGRLTNDGSTIRYGAEVRSIGSANVYGNYGAVADGADTLMYLINHNFAYIGTGTDSSNDRTLVIQANETVELNSGKIHYTSFDHVGTFRVGDTFWIDLKNGTTSFDLSSVSVGDLAGVKFIDGDDITFIDFSRVETGNIQISGNIVRSNLGDINFQSASNEINLTQDVFITENLDITNNLNISGQLNLGNQISDTVSFEAEIDDNLDPKADNSFTIGSSSRNWKNIWTRTAKITDIEINTNYIRTTISNADLDLRASGTGSILLEDVRVNQNLISTDSSNLQITPFTTLDITASTTNINGALDVSQNLIIDSNTTFGNNVLDTIRFESNINTSLEPSITATFNLGDSLHSWNLYAGKILLDDIEINDNYIKTTVSNLNLELRASGVGSIQIEQTFFNENLIYTTGTNLKIEPATTLDIIGDTLFDSDLNVTANISFDSDINLGTDATDNINFISNINSSIIPQISNIHELGSSSKSWNLYTGKIFVDEIEINDNYIQTITSNLNLEFKANGTGSVQTEKTYFNENLIYTVGNNLRIEPATTLDIFGNTNLTGNLRVTTDVYLDSNFTLGNTSSDTVYFNSLINSSIIPNYNATYELGDNLRSWNLYTNLFLLDDIEINDNYIKTTSSNLNLEFRASGSGSVLAEQTFFNENLIYTVGTNLKIEPATTLDITASTTTINGNSYISNDVYLDSNFTLGDTISDTVYFNSFINSSIIPYVNETHSLGNDTKSWNLFTNLFLLDDIEINDNYIKTTSSNLNLEFRASGNGSIKVEQTYINENLIYTLGNNLRIEPATTLDITASTTNINGILHVTNNVFLDSNFIVGDNISDNISVLARVSSDIIPFVDSSVNLGSTTKSWNLYTDKILLDDIEINDNYIQGLVSNINLEFKANGTGSVRFERTDFNENVIRSLGSEKLELRPGGILDIFATTNVTGDVDITGNFDWQGTITFGNATTDDVVFVSDINSDIVPDVDATYNLGSLAKRWNTSFSRNSVIGDIEINTNYITTTNGNKDLDLRGNSSGAVRLEDLRFLSNTLLSGVTNQNIQFNLSGSSILDMNTTQALKIPTGTLVNRPISNMLSGEIRFNTTDSLFAGLTTARVTFGGVYSQNRLTYARAEPTSNRINFITNSINPAYIDSSKVWLTGLSVDNINIQNNIISTNNINLILDPDASNTVDIDSFRFDDNIINNLTSNSLTFASTGQGYVKFNGTLGIVIPAGDDAGRGLTPEDGTTRWNTDDGWLEVYFGGTWQLATATSGSAFASEAEVAELADLYALILG